MPARLCYSPRVYAYTRDQNGATLNLTPWIVKGEVARKVNQVSSAELTLRNPYRRFTTPSRGVAFHPMDPITIYLERLQGHPVRVFTGYLDTTPYYQLFPGTITLKASCTLKRLLYTWFDPALPHIMAFFAKYGWIPTGSGSIINPNAFGNTQPVADIKKLNDSSFGKLLWATLYEIGNWRDTDLYIEDIPLDIAKRMSQLMSSEQGAQDAATKEFTDFMQAVVGGSSQGAAAAAATGVGGGQVTSSLLNDKQKAFGSALSQATGLDPNVVAAWELAEEPASASAAPNGTNNWLNIGATDTKFVGSGNSFWDDPSTAGKFSAAWIHGTSEPGFGTASQGIQDILKSVGKSPQAQLQAIQSSGWASGGYPDLNSIYQHVVGSPGAATVSSQTQASGGSLTGGAGGNGASVGTATVSGVASGVSSGGKSALGNIFPYNTKGITVERTDAGVDFSVPDGTPVGAIADGKMGPTIHDWYNGEPFIQVILDQPIDGYPAWYIAEGIDISGTPSEGTPVKAGQKIAVIRDQQNGIETGWSNGTQQAAADQGTGDSVGPAGTSFAHYIGVPVSSSTVGPLDWSKLSPGANGSAAGGTNSTGQATNTQNASAFVAELEFPSIQDQVTAVALGTAHRGLMHDQALMPFVQQIAQASLRSFQSLPDGSFYAFYPDYFGEFNHHPPYWLIDDIEILSGEIQLSDDALATHVFAVGDNTWPVNEELLNQLFSAGNINIFNAFVNTGPTNTKDKKSPFKDGRIDDKAKSDGFDALMNHEEAVAFIERFGARPLVQNYPMVHSNLFEMLLGYQQFMLAWSNQFKTPFTFTFMPELYPGGKLGFPNHGLQMYINSVTHTFSYEEGGGFTTSAELSAPSVLGNPADFPNLPPKMIDAIIEPVRADKKKPKSTGADAAQAAIQATSDSNIGDTLANLGTTLTDLSI